jgi:hypothetical protein
MTMRAVVSFAALIGLLGLTPRPSTAASCEDLLAGNAYSCTVVSQFVPEATGGGSQTICASFDDLDPGNGLLTVSLGEGPETLPCVCGTKGRITNPKLGEGADVTCISPDGAVFMGKATKKGLKKGFAFDARAPQNDNLFECTLDPACAPSSGGCGLEGDICGGSCPDGSECVNTGQDVPSCECVDAGLTCSTTAALAVEPSAALTSCSQTAYCPGVYETCGVNAVSGACQCATLTE